MQVVGIRRAIVALLACAAAGALAGQRAASAVAEPALVGEWSAPIQLGMPAIHSAMLHTGKVLIWSTLERGSGVGTRAAVWDPSTGTITPATIPFQADTFCGGQVFLADGRVFTVGGRKYGAPRGWGSLFTNLFDPIAQVWSHGPDMAQPRWYPGAIELPDGDALALRGNVSPGVPVAHVERYHPATNTLTALPASADRNLGLYPRAHVLPDGRVIVTSPKPRTLFFDPAANRWSAGPSMNFGTRFTGMSVLLPGLQKLLVAGGRKGGTTTNTAEILDLSQPQPQWRFTAPMATPRIWGNAVVLADGTVLVVGGGGANMYDFPALTAELFDPASETWTTMAAQQGGRMYHSTALLLPDGRVLSAGQDFGPFATTGEIFSPPYLFRGARPTVTAAPGTLSYGQSFTIATPDAGAIRHVALVKAATVTHSVNFDQRYLNASFTAGAGVLTASAPASAAQATPGWYMLFLLNAEGVPSLARWLRIG